MSSLNVRLNGIFVKAVILPLAFFTALYFSSSIILSSLQAEIVLLASIFLALLFVALRFGLEYSFKLLIAALGLIPVLIWREDYLVCTASVIVVFFISGMPLVNYLLERKLNVKVGLAERIFLYFTFSLLVSPIIATPSIMVGYSRLSQLIIKLLLFILALVSSLTSDVRLEKLKGSFKLKPMIIIMVLLLLALSAIVYVYPEQALHYTMDIVFHHSSTVKLIYAKPHLGAIPAHIYQLYYQLLAALYLESNVLWDLTKILEVLAFFGFLIVSLAIYCLSKAFIKSFYGRILSVVLFVFGGGFGWLYTVKLLMEGLNLTRAYAYSVPFSPDLGAGFIQTWIWFRAYTIGTALFLFYLYLAFRGNFLGEARSLIEILVLSLILCYHIAEYYLLMPVLALIILLGRSNLKDVSLKVTLAFLFSLALYLISGLKRSFTYIPTYILSYVLMMVICVLAYLIRLSSKRLKFCSRCRIIRILALTASLILFSLSVACVIYWLKFGVPYGFSYMPLYVVPVMLGLQGLLILFPLCFLELLDDSFARKLILLLILMFVFIELTVYIRSSPLLEKVPHIIRAGYDDKRLILTGICPLIPILCVRLIWRLKKNGRTLILLSLLLMSFPSTFLTVYGKKACLKLCLVSPILSKEEFNVVRSIYENRTLMRSLLNTSVICLDQYSMKITKFIPAYYVMAYRRIPLDELETPTTLFRILNSFDRRVGFLWSYSIPSPLISCLANCSETIKLGGPYKLTLAPDFVAPQVKGSITIVPAGDFMDAIPLAMALSLMKLNYSIAPIEHIPYLKSEVIMLLEYNNLGKIKEHLEEGKNIIVFLKNRALDLRDVRVGIIPLNLGYIVVNGLKVDEGHILTENVRNITLNVNVPCALRGEYVIRVGEISSKRIVSGEGIVEEVLELGKPLDISTYQYMILNITSRGLQYVKRIIVILNDGEVRYIVECKLSGVRGKIIIPLREAFFKCERYNVKVRKNLEVKSLRKVDVIFLLSRNVNVEIEDIEFSSKPKLRIMVEIPWYRSEISRVTLWFNNTKLYDYNLNVTRKASHKASITVPISLNSKVLIKVYLHIKRGLTYVYVEEPYTIRLLRVGDTVIPIVFRREHGKSIIYVQASSIISTFKEGRIKLRDYIKVLTLIVKHVVDVGKYKVKEKACGSLYHIYIRDISTQGYIKLRALDAPIAVHTGRNIEYCWSIILSRIQILRRYGDYAEAIMYNVSLPNGNFLKRAYATIYGRCVIEANGTTLLKGTYTLGKYSWYGAWRNTISITGYTKLILEGYDTYLTSNTLISKGEVKGVDYTLFTGKLNVLKVLSIMCSLEFILTLVLTTFIMVIWLFKGKYRLWLR